MRRVLAVLLVGSALAPRSAAASDDDWYPTDITPPAGTQYPCALTALPRDLPGIPPGDRRFINHSYSMVLKATHAKLVLLHVLAGAGPYEAARGKYLQATDDARRRVSAEAVPSGLDGFAADVVAAIDGQQSFFKAAARDRARGLAMAEVYKNPDGRRASERLFAAWAEMQKRYPAWSPAVKDSVYHHLCALDLF